MVNNVGQNEKMNEIFPTGLFCITEIKKGGAENRVQKLFQSMMSSVSGIQSGEETSINVLLRTPHFKEILTRHSNMHYKCSNALPELVSKHYFLILEFGKISDKQHLLLEIRKWEHTK